LSVHWQNSHYSYLLQDKKKSGIDNKTGCEVDLMVLSSAFADFHLMLNRILDEQGISNY